MPRLHSFIFPVLIVLIFSITSCFRVGENESSDIEAINPKIDKLKLPSGFHAEHLYSPSENEMGSWVSMTFDPQGRLITSDQYGSLYRMELPPIGSDSLRPKVEKLEVNMGHAQGLLWAFNSLYVMVNNNPKDFDKQSGLYRLQDTNNDGQFNKVTLLKELKGEGEHGPHSIILAPDGNSLFVINGNHTDVPKMDAYRVPPVWDEDNLFPLIKDPGGHATDRMAPGGWVANVDSLGQHWELYSAGYRNAYDLAINEAGDMFTFDSDMEWDLGTPWYRPTRICHVTSGSEYGWRTGSGKWSPAFPDNLPPVINMGQGSPTGVIHGKSSNFPEKYQKALYAFDWSFGIIYAIHLQPNGASYTAEAEEFISGMPLPLTDGIIGPDGAMYFMTGGRRLESDVYRVFYKGAENAKLSSRKIASSSISEETQLRREIEKFHGRQDQAAINFIWPHLKNPDRFIRFAARIALEHQPVNQWQEKILNEKDPDIKIEGLIALARHGQKIMREPMIKALSAISFDQLSESKQVDLLRAYEIMFFRMGMPAEPNKQVILSQLNNHYPSKTDLLNRQLSKVLIYLEAPQVAERTMALLEKAKNSTEKDDRYNQASELILRNPQYGLDIA
ncbi:MAG: heme-binding protein, partial [Bacteroidota bacterium]|nr:heme-binding protein [Bacteroidota bacterium]